MKVLVWDIPTRLFHWLLAAAFAVAYITGETENLFPLHVFAGLLMLVLIAYRLVWGFMGSRYAKFSSFMYSPVAAGRYVLDVIKGSAKRFIGHNPAGSWAIYLLLLLGAGAAISGLMGLLGNENFEEIHEVLANGMLILVVVHLVGVLVESLAHKENLPRAMVTGQKDGSTEQGIASARPLGAVVLIALVAATGAVFLKGYDAAQQTLTLPFLSQPLDLSHEGGEGHEHGEHDGD